MLNLTNNDMTRAGLTQEPNGAYIHTKTGLVLEAQLVLIDETGVELGGFRTTTKALEMLAKIVESRRPVEID